MSESKESTRSGNGFLVAGILAAIGASACCVGPLVLLASGVSGAWISSLTVLEPYRPIFIGLTLLFLVAGVTSATVDFDKKTASVTFDPDKASPATLAKATSDAGYPSSVHN